MLASLGILLSLHLHTLFKSESRFAMGDDEKGIEDSSYNEENRGSGCIIMCDWNVTHKKISEELVLNIFFIICPASSLYLVYSGLSEAVSWGVSELPHRYTAGYQHVTKELYSIVSYTAPFLSPLCCHSNWVCVRFFDCVVCITKHSFMAFASASLKYFTYSHFSLFFKSTLSQPIH